MMKPAGDPPGEEVLSSEVAFHGRVFDLRVDTVRLPTGGTARRDVIVHPGAVVIAAVDADGSVILERQYRSALQRVICELPAGTLEPGEPPEACARRELTEETGYRAERWQQLGGFYSAPGFCTEYLHAFLATELTSGLAAVEEDEQIALLRVPLAEALAMIARGEICDAKSVVTLNWAAQRLQAAQTGPPERSSPNSRATNLTPAFGTPSPLGGEGDGG